MVEICRTGTTRLVILTKLYAIKIPNLLNGWDLFLRGLLGNQQEKIFSATGWVELCPVLFALPGGFLNVMPRARPLTTAEWEEFDIDSFLENDFRIIPAERKRDSFGVLNGRIVAVDYGS